MFLKKGVSVSKLKPEMWFALGFFQAAYAMAEAGEVTVTSTNDSTEHHDGSLHYANLAVDARTHGLSQEQKGQVLRFLRHALDPFGYDTILESIGLPREHLHCEYDAKAGEQLIAPEV